MAKLHPRFKLWLSSEDVQGAFGDGKWRLLQAIEKTGSLTKACKLLNISYRKAWGDLAKAESSLGVALLQKHRGGAKGGRTVLTTQGKKWAKSYARFRRNIEKCVDRAYAEHIKELVK